MIIYKITLDIYGNLFSPRKLIDKISDELECYDCHESSDTFTTNGEIHEYGFGYLSLRPSQKVCIDEEVVSYNNLIIQFLKKNYTLLSKEKGNEIVIYYNVYFSGKDFCISIFDKDLLRIVGECNAALDFSAYQLSEEDLKLSEEELIKTFD